MRTVFNLSIPGPHNGQPVLAIASTPGIPTSAAGILLHGRGASAEDILTLAAQLNLPELTFWAPQAVDHAWYPNRFQAALASNQPWLDSALAAVGALLANLQAAGIPPERTLLLGFSQGACLALEFAARSARRYGGLVGLSGGLIGPDGTPRTYPGTLDGTPVFLGCSDVDPHIPKERVLETARVLSQLGGQVTTRLYPKMAHTVNLDEIQAVRELVRSSMLD